MAIKPPINGLLRTLWGKCWLCRRRAVCALRYNSTRAYLCHETKRRISIPLSQYHENKLVPSENYQYDSRLHQCADRCCVLGVVDAPSLSIPLVLGIIAGGLVDLDHRLTGSG